MTDVKAGVYEGGIPNQGFDGTFPKTASQGEMYQPDPTSGEVDKKDGGPTSTSDKSADGGFVMNNESYNGMSPQLEPDSMKTVNLDDIKSTV